MCRNSKLRSFKKRSKKSSAFGRPKSKPGLNAHDSSDVHVMFLGVFEFLVTLWEKDLVFVWKYKKSNSSLWGSPSEAAIAGVKNKTLFNTFFLLWNCFLKNWVFTNSSLLTEHIAMFAKADKNAWKLNHIHGLNSTHIFVGDYLQHWVPTG